MLRDKENCKYSEILEEDTIRQAEMKEKITKEYFRRTKKLFETKLCHKNLIKDKHLGSTPCKIDGTILEMDAGRLQ